MTQTQTPATDEDLVVKIFRRDGTWRVRIGEGAIPELFDSFAEAADEAKAIVIDAYDEKQPRSSFKQNGGRVDLNLHANNARPVRSISWPDSETETGQYLASGDGQGALVFAASHHGDHDEFWVVLIKDGIEVARYNVRHLESITWAEQ